MEQKFENSAQNTRNLLVIDSNNVVSVQSNEGEINSSITQTRDTSVENIDLVKSANPPLPFKAPQHHRHNQLKEQVNFEHSGCLQCAVKDQKILELEEIAKKSIQFTPANMLKPTEVKDCSMANTVDIEFDCPIKYGEIQACFPPPILADDDMEIVVFGKLNIRSKRVHSISLKKSYREDGIKVTD